MTPTGATALQIICCPPPPYWIAIMISRAKYQIHQICCWLVHCLLVFIPHTDQDGDDEAYEDGEDDLASDAAGVQKEARSSEAAQSRGRTATLVWSGLAGRGETFWEFEIAHRMNLQLKRASRQFGKIPFYRAKISSQGQVRRRCLQRSPPCHHSLCSPFK